MRGHSLKIFRKLLYLSVPFATASSIYLQNRGYFQFVAEPKGNLISADVFIVLGFGIVRGTKSKNEAGRSNLALAKWLLENNPDYKPAIMQFGIQLALIELGIPNLDEWVVVLPDHPRIHVDTRAAMLQAWAIMDKQGYKMPVIVCNA